MNPALNGATIYTTPEIDFVYVIGGQCKANKPNANIYKINKKTPATMEVVCTLKVPRVDPLVIPAFGKLLVIGGSATTLIESVDIATWKLDAGMEAKSESFFAQLACYTGDTKLENCTYA